MLNPILYEALKKKFGTVKISNEGASYIGKKNLKVKNGRTFYEITDINRGEQYCVNCPACGGKFKLTISYICGTITPPFTEIVWHKLHCFRCNYGKSHGNGDALKEILGGYVKLANNVSIKISHGTVSQPKPLEDYGTLGDLHPDSSAGVYVQGRGFDVNILRTKYNMKRIVTPIPTRLFLREYLFIPMYADGKLVSWQGRAIFPKQQPRWYIAQGSKKPVFNLDLAVQTNHIIIQEGVFDAIACGYSGVAITGKYLTGFQAEQLGKVRKPIIVCLDPDAKEDAKKLYLHLKETHGSRVTLFQYPDAWPEEYNIDKNKMIPMDAAAVGASVIQPLIREHIAKNYNL